jgi:asparagine synthase (glutamine-hydrolysing)
MCGICGVLDLRSARPVSEELVRRMTEVIRHRGPDDEGFYFGPGAALGHRRLSIIDLAGGHQPVENETGDVRVVFNGEIYNYAGLAADLKRAGHVFRTRSDTETILHAYEEYGVSAVERLRGMFAFAIWDEPRRRLLLARDRMGIKPLYYTVCGGRLLFASEIKSILQDPSVPREIDDEALEQYLGLRYVPDPRTMFRGIFKLPRGRVLVA